MLKFEQKPQNLPHPLYHSTNRPTPSFTICGSCSKFCDSWNSLVLELAKWESGQRVILKERGTRSALQKGSHGEILILGALTYLRGIS